jgi:hypothetical protein
MSGNMGCSYDKHINNRKMNSREIKIIGSFESTPIN